MLLFFLACAPQPLVFCQGDVGFDYAPDVQLSVFPDDHYSVLDSSTVTGRRVAISRQDTDAVADFPENYQNWLEDLSTLDGFGLSSGIFLGFDTEIAPLEELDIGLWVMGETPQSWPHDLSTTDGGRTLMLHPTRALPSAAEILVLLRNAPDDAQCVAPGPVLSDLLDPLGRQVDESAHSLRVHRALEKLEVPPEQVAALTLFTTQSAHDQSLAIAQDIRARGPEMRDISCQVQTWGQLCEASLEAWDYRVDGVVPPGEIQARSAYTLPVTLWIPQGEGPFPVVICGHGLGGGREQCDAIQPSVAQSQIAVVAIDAVEHGDHPARTEPPLAILDKLMIFALQISPPGLAGLVMRDNFRQSAWDKLHLVLALQQTVDLDGDGVGDLDGGHLGYAGVSLGAIMGPELLALAPEIQAGWLAVGGARVTQIIHDGPEFAPLIELMTPPGMQEGEVDRAFPLLQTLMDPGEPAIWAARVQLERSDEGSAPDIYLGAVLDDQIVPNSTNALMAQAFQAPGVGQEHFAVTGVDFTPGSVSGNGPGGATLGFVQYDQVFRNGQWEDADHSHLHDSEQGLEALLAFFEDALFLQQAATIIDPDAD
ncbi:MAG: dienelactone hydrolase [Cognaticolwellia sp.]|jgi:dienelactone hydrolase